MAVLGSRIVRCAWATNEQLIHYHDMEWGIPLHDDRLLFELLLLEGAQAGLSWNTILQKREVFREAFDHFDPALIANYHDQKVQQLLHHAGIIRNRRKINSAITNAKACLAASKAFGSFDAYIWQFVGKKPIKNHWETFTDVPCHTTESHAMSTDLKRRGFSFVGPTICYAFMQATGMVNDHTCDCFCYQKLA